MNKIIEPEKSELRMLLMKQMEKFIENLPDGNNIGWMPDDVIGLMADASFAVLMAIHETNVYMEKEDLVK